MVRPSRIAAWWSTMTRGVPSSRESVRTEVHTLEVMWLSSADYAGLRMPTPVDLTGRERRARRSGGMVVGVVPSRRAGRKAVQIAVSIGEK